ncbi:MAG: type II toxin-antitoxin system PemK/MazF family toxin [Thermomonas sp.]|nr:type II toxin-antitoxin system PemK/MazF family toxin [Thermomonas sp.]
MKRGEIWWADLSSPVGSGSRLQAPVLVVEANPFNASRIATIVVATITSDAG